MYRKGGYIVGRIAGLLAVLLMAAVVAIQMPIVQTRLSKLALNRLASILDGRIQYDELKVMTSGVLVIRNLSLVDNDPYTEDIYERGWAPDDTVFRARSITATFAIDGLLKGEGLHLGRVTVEDGYMHLISEPVAPGNNLTRILKLTPQDPVEPLPNLFDIKKVRVKNFRFRLTSFLESKVPHRYDAPHIDFEDLDVTADITAHNLKMAGGVMSGFCDKLTAREKSGFSVQELTGSAEVGQGKALIEDLHLRDQWSDVSFRTLLMTFDGPQSFADFLNAVKLDGDIQRSRVAMQTISYFSGGAFEGSPLVFNIQRGRPQGFVSNFQVNKLTFTEQDSNVSAIIDGTVSGLPDVMQFALNLQVKDLVTTTEGISRIVNGFAPTAKLNLSQLAHNLPLTLQVRTEGLLNELGFSGEMETPDGSADFTGEIRYVLEPQRPIELTAALNTRELDLGRVLGNNSFGPVSLSTRARAVLRNGLPDADVDTLRIDRIHAFGRDFQHINATANLQGGTVNAYLRSDDPAARLELNALADLTERAEGKRYRVDGTLSDLDLTAIGFENEKVSRIATGIHADLVQNGEFFDGNARLPGLRLTNASGTYPLGDLNIQADTLDGMQHISLDAPFLEARYSGSHAIPRFVQDLQAVSVQRDLSALVQREAPAQATGKYDLSLLFHDTRNILAILLPGAYIEDLTALSVSLDGNGKISGNLQSKRIAMGQNYLKDAQLEFDNLNEALALHLLASELRAGSFAMSLPTIKASADDNDFAVGVLYDSFSGAGGSADISLLGRISRDEEGQLVVQARPVDSYLMAAGKNWSFGESDILLHGKDLFLNHFQISNGPQRLLLDGGLSQSAKDTLTLQMDRFDLALVDDFLPKALGIEGKMDGRAYLTADVGETLGMLMDFSIDTLKLGGVNAGSIVLSSAWKDDGKELGLLLQDRLEGRNALDVHGTYAPRTKQLDLHATLDNLPVNVAAPFLKQVFTEMDGGISGSLSLQGPTDDLTPTSDLHLDDTRLRIAATGVSYTIQGPLRIDGEGCYFDALQVRDDSEGTGTLQGTLNFNHLRDFRLNSHLNFTNLKIVDAVLRTGQAFYGLARASGSATVSGPFNALLIDANVSTVGDGDVHIPLSGKLASASSNLLTFTEPVRELDAYETMMASLQQGQAASSDIRIRGRVALHPGLKAFVEIDKNAGNTATFSGAGNISLNIRPSKAILELNGDYNINEGNYQFVVPGVLSKGFSIQRGSSVQFGGDIMNTVLNVAAQYNLRTSLEPITGMESSSRRLVECGINVTDRLRSPKVDLSINVPDLDPSTRSQVESALSTADKVQKQFVSLLLLGTFLPNESSGIFNQSNLLLSNMTEMASNQINGILQRMEIPIDVGFGYQQMGSGRNLFDISLSTQLFDNRVLLSGNFGNRRYSTGSTRGDFTGNLDLSVKLDTEGKFRFNVFSHSADEFTSYLDYSQRNGLGVSYQREYSTFSELCRSFFISTEKWEAMRQELLEKEIEQEVIEIKNEPGETLPYPDPPRRNPADRNAPRVRP